MSSGYYGFKILVSALSFLHFLFQTPFATDYSATEGTKKDHGWMSHSQISLPRHGKRKGRSEREIGCDIIRPRVVFISMLAHCDSDLKKCKCFGALDVQDEGTFCCPELNRLPCTCSNAFLCFSFCNRIVFLPLDCQGLHFAKNDYFHMDNIEFRHML